MPTEFGNILLYLTTFATTRLAELLVCFSLGFFSILPICPTRRYRVAAGDTIVSTQSTFTSAQNVWAKPANSAFYSSCLISSHSRVDETWESTRSALNSITVIVAWFLASSHQTAEPYAHTTALMNAGMCIQCRRGVPIPHSLRTVRALPAHADLTVFETFHAPLTCHFPCAHLPTLSRYLLLTGRVEDGASRRSQGPMRSDLLSSPDPARKSSSG